MVRKVISKALHASGLRKPKVHRVFREARYWSNDELRKIGSLFSGKIINVSAWEDRDKQDGFYKDYFPKASSYHISNFGTDQGVLQNVENEIYLDLEQPLSDVLQGAYDVVFNHTTLEHVYRFREAFGNMCKLSNDIVIMVVPWMQPLHSNYGDYWRFSPQAMVRMFEDEGLTPLKISWNTGPRASVYVFAVASKHPERWRKHFPDIIESKSADFHTLPPHHAGSAAF